MDIPILSLLIFLPLLAVPALALIPRSLPGTIRGVTLGVMLLTFGAALKLYFDFDPDTAAFQFEENREWVLEAIRYRVGVDGISILLVMLTTFLLPIALLSSVRSITHKVREFCIALLVLESAMLGTFLALDLFVFYVFWEIMLFPVTLIIGVWGGKRRIHASVKFVIYTMAGSLLMLVAILYIYYKNGAVTFDYNVLLAAVGEAGSLTSLRMKEQVFLFLAFGLAFAIRIPLFPLHTWLPGAQVEAPTAGSVILAGVLLKMGAYAFIRFAIPFFPQAAALFSGPLMALAVVGIIYGALVAWAQEDMKKLVAYSSVSHMGLIMLGIFAMTREGVAGGVLQMVNHGLSTGALFLCVGFLYDRRHTRLMRDYGGVARAMPFFAAVFLLVSLSSIGLPGTNGFVGEFLILAGTFKEGIGSELEPGNVLCWRNQVIVLGVLATTGVVLGAVYMLTMLRRVLFGPAELEENRGLKDLTGREKLVILPIVAFILLIGIAPGLFLQKIYRSVDVYVENYQPKLMEKRNPETATRKALMMRQLMRMQFESSVKGEEPPSMDMRNLEWKLGPYQGGGERR